MVPDREAKRYRHFYVMLLRLYPLPFRTRFGEGMAQTFNDLCRERRETGRGILALVLWTFVETSAGIFKERMAVTMQTINVVRPALITTILLLVPALAMRMTEEVAWGPGDFLVAGVLLFGTGLVYEWVAGRTGDVAFRAGVGLAVAAALILVWTNIAVGLIGADDNAANLMYVGVLAVGIIGALVARFRPRGMARALLATALAQALVAVITLVTGLGQPVTGPLEVVAINGFFVALFIGSAWLFRRAAYGGRAQTDG